MGESLLLVPGQLLSAPLPNEENLLEGKIKDAPRKSPGRVSHPLV
jgi:hypothetical protein